MWRRGLSATDILCFPYVLVILKCVCSLSSLLSCYSEPFADEKFFYRFQVSLVITIFARKLHFSSSILFLFIPFPRPIFARGTVGHAGAEPPGAVAGQRQR